MDKERDKDRTLTSHHRGVRKIKAQLIMIHHRWRDEKMKITERSHFFFTYAHENIKLNKRSSHDDKSYI